MFAEPQFAHHVVAQIAKVGDRFILSFWRVPIAGCRQVGEAETYDDIEAAQKVAAMYSVTSGMPIVATAEVLNTPFSKSVLARRSKEVGGRNG